ncbi:O-antigen ligase family protein [Sedimentitalea nanhaiensis]|uniref:O-antigen ligase-related domain-containing protein n=1 Tax=Sedimentitalea nanhaiensis TaxID=999627 RepID=A0A1I7DLK0_9RHOB|nr:O-antigen ligase family protein [Sedimentitalea nanhaiensis]SFU12561.1 hypothetical protein SAMN05216236_13024 [Sedimentitalea nanhaiensis]
MPPLLALFSWPLVVVVLARKFRPALAFILAILTGFLLLPETIAFDLPMLPALTKHTVPVLSVVLFITLFQTGKGKTDSRSLIPEHPFVRIAVVGLVLGALLTVATNGDPLRYGPKVQPGMRLYDGFAHALTMAMMLLPMLLARKFLARPETHVLLLRVLCFAALFYSLLALFEVRMSPQLNQWVYGFFPHSWRQHYRGGGWRPIVFLSHGLVVSLFFCCATLAAAGLSRLYHKQRGKFLAAMAWLFLTLVLTKSLGALVIVILMLPAALLWGVRGQLLTACAIAVLVLVYPIGRSTGVIPIQQVAQIAESISPERAASFMTRVVNEDRLLAKAQQRPWFGWGLWGRSRISDPITGVDITIVDGLWIGMLGASGWVGYLSNFGLLCLPIILLFRHLRRYDIGMESSILALVLAANLIDLLPNSGLTPVTWVVAGALWGRLELGRIETETDTVSTDTSGNSGSIYTRLGKQIANPARSGTRQNQYTRQKSRHARK